MNTAGSCELYAPRSHRVSWANLDSGWLLATLNIKFIDIVGTIGKQEITIRKLKDPAF